MLATKDSDPYEKVLARLAGRPAAPERSETIALVIPPSPQIPTPGREFLVSGPFEGFTAIATVVRKLGYKLKVIDCRPPGGETSAFVLGRIAGASAVGIAAYCDSFVFLRDSAGAIKAAFPEKLLFLGGPLVSSLPEMLLREVPADCALLGEAELTLLELLETVFARGSRDLSGVKGLAYRDGNSIKLTGPRPQIRDLDNLPFPDYTIWPDYENIAKDGRIIISSSRGCPCRCSFCFKTIPELRLKSLERFEAEVEHLKRTTGFNYTWLNDLTFNADTERAMKISDILFRHGVKYHCFARVANVTAAFAEKLKTTGCEGIWFGIESYDQRVLELCRKNTTLAQIDQALENSAKAGLRARGLFIVGLPGETEESLKGMLEYIRKGGFIPLVKNLMPFPGTELYRDAVDTGKIKDARGFLEMLSERRVGDQDDPVRINLTGLDENLLNDHFHRIWELTREKAAAQL